MSVNFSRCSFAWRVLLVGHLFNFLSYFQLLQRLPCDFDFGWYFASRNIVATFVTPFPCSPVTAEGHSKIVKSKSFTVVNFLWNLTSHFCGNIFLQNSNSYIDTLAWIFLEVHIILTVHPFNMLLEITYANLHLT